MQLQRSVKFVSLSALLPINKFVSSSKSRFRSGQGQGLYDDNIWDDDYAWVNDEWNDYMHLG